MTATSKEEVDIFASYLEVKREDAMTDTDRNERINAPLHPEVVQWVANMVKAVRAHKRPAEVIADFERLLAMAKGGAP